MAKKTNMIVPVDEDAINVFTDGSAQFGPNRGGIGVRLVTVDEVSGDEVEENIEFPGYKGATIAMMELQACIEGLKEAARHPKLGGLERICIFSDSKYVVDHVSDARFNWPPRWRGADGRPIQNAELWKELVRLIKRSPKPVKFKWVPGKSNVHNKAVDKLAKKSADNPINEPMSLKSVRRKITDERVDIGSVKMRGQTLDIGIIEAEYLRASKTNRYRYEVLTEDSEFYGKVDFIYTPKYMREGHHYRVVVNHNAKNPEVVEIVGELDRSLVSRLSSLSETLTESERFSIREGRLELTSESGGLKPDDEKNASLLVGALLQMLNLLINQLADSNCDPIINACLNDYRNQITKTLGTINPIRLDGAYRVASQTYLVEPDMLSPGCQQLMNEIGLRHQDLRDLYPDWFSFKSALAETATNLPEDIDAELGQAFDAIESSTVSISDEVKALLELNEKEASPERRRGTGTRIVIGIAYAVVSVTPVIGALSDWTGFLDIVRRLLNLLPL